MPEVRSVQVHRHPLSPTGMYWNTRGNIRCEQEIEQTRRDSEGWGPIPESEEPHKRYYQGQQRR